MYGQAYSRFPYSAFWLKQAAASSSNPFGEEWLATVLSSWQPPDPLPTLPRQLNPSITAVRVDNPPFSLRRFQPPPIPDQVAPQVLPDFNPAVFAPAAYLPPGRAWVSGVLAAWQPLDPAAQWTRQLNPSITAVRVDNPPFGLKQWQPIPVQDPPQPYAPRYKQIVSVAPAAYVPYAPVWMSVVEAWQPPDPSPQYPRLLNASLTAVRVDNPPFGLRPWQPIPIEDPPQAQPPLYRQIVSIAQVAQTPYTIAWLSSVLSSWQPPDPSPQLPRQMIAAVIALQVTYVPRAPTWLSSVIQAWQPLDPAPQFPVRLTPPSVDNPPFGLRPLRTFDVVDQPAPQQLRPLSPAITGVPVVYVPFNHAWVSNVVQAWQPPDPAAQWTRQLNPQITAVRVDNPPPFHLDQSAVRAWWDMPPGMPIMRLTTLPPQGGIVAYVQTVVSSPKVIVTVGSMTIRTTVL